MLQALATSINATSTSYEH